MFNKDMFEGKDFMNRMFQRVDGMAWDMMTGKVGLRTAEGLATLDMGPDNLVDDAQISINVFDGMSMPIPAFAQSVPVASIVVGDMIYDPKRKKLVGWVIEKNADNKMKLMTESGTYSNWKPAKINMMGFDPGVLVVRSLMTMLPGGAAGVGQMQNQMMLMMQMGMLENDNDMDSLMPMMLMSQMGGLGGTPGAPGGDMMSQLMPMMMMKKFMSNGNSNNAPKNGKSYFDQNRGGN